MGLSDHASRCASSGKLGPVVRTGPLKNGRAQGNLTPFAPFQSILLHFIFADQRHIAYLYCNNDVQQRCITYRPVRQKLSLHPY
jgi:hypothetical protein